MVQDHTPVLYHEALEALNVTRDGIYFDATYGRGGHSRGILTQLGQGRLFVFDKDPDANEHAKKQMARETRMCFYPGSFTQMQTVAAAEQMTGQVNGILMDLGVSSPQLDSAERGFSFKREGPLDMRMDTTSGVSAQTWIHRVSQSELENVLRGYGEERFAKRIALAIIKARTNKIIKTTTQLAEIIAKAHPKWEKKKHPATRSFQAIRIAVNRELEDLEIALHQALVILKTGGRLVVISFHSLEDGLVKRFIQREAKGDTWPEDLPITADMMRPKLKKKGKMIRPSQSEVELNPRARAARMRVAEKC